jgi:hypothetical protein
MNYRAGTIGAHLSIMPGPTNGLLVKCILELPSNTGQSNPSALE